MIENKNLQIKMNLVDKHFRSKIFLILKILNILKFLKNKFRFKEKKEQESSN